jgi:ubiquinone/menaquinone biosynthesis C-methylase UbiE
MDEQKFHEFLNTFVGDLGATVGAGAVVLGDQLGLYAALAEGPQTPDVLAASTGTAARYVEEWLRGQAAGGYVGYDAGAGTYHLTEEQAFALTDPDGPVFLPGAFQLALGALHAVPRLAEAFRTGEGIGWHEHDEDVFVGCERFFRPGYSAHLMAEWLPALDGVVAKLTDGAKVADVGCGLGASTTLMARAYPSSTFTGSDYHTHSIELARKSAAELGLSPRVAFEVAGATTFDNGPYDLVTTFDCLHDMGDPVAAARHIREQLADDGTWMVVEPAAADSVEENLNPVGRVFYGFSAFLCVPNAVSQGGSQTLGAQAGETAIRQVVEEGGFASFRRVAETPFNLVYEVRP